VVLDGVGCFIIYFFHRDKIEFAQLLVFYTIYFRSVGKMTGMLHRHIKQPQLDKSFLGGVSTINNLLVELMPPVLYGKIKDKA
jgi:hypothetical protein